MIKIIKHFKAEPTEFVKVSVSGKTKKEGQGITCLYVPMWTSFELVSMTSSEQGFTITEISSDKQETAIQGGLVYRVKEPLLTFEAFNHTIDPVTREYLTEDYRGLTNSIIELASGAARKVVQETELERLLVMSQALSEEMRKSIESSDLLKRLGINIENLFISSIKPKPDIQRALEANYREKKLLEADKASYERRAAGVEAERAIRLQEVETDRNVQEQRAEVILLEGNNIKSLAEARAEAEKRRLSVYDGKDAELIRALALLEIGQNAAKIGTLTITPEILVGLGSVIRG